MSIKNADHPSNRKKETGNEAFWGEKPATHVQAELRTVISVKELLKQCLEAQRDAEFYEERISRLESLRERMTTRLTGLPRGTLQFDESAVIAELEELKAEFARRLIYATREAVRLFDMLAGLPESQQLILRMRYIDGMSWEEIAGATKYSKDHCLWLHRHAITQLKSVPIPEEGIKYLQR